MRSKAMQQEECRPEPRIGELVTALVRQAAAGGSDIPGEGLLLDMEVEGVRCVLRRVEEQPLLLSPREREIARMVAQGYPNKTIGAVLEISTWTVGTYLRRIFAKCGVTSRAAMVAKVMGRSR